ncbi:hypothetical protein ACFPL7_06180 [Dongia soli]|uniref:Uncharacterized protein n=1 Tax=Dongia soli TaxID=600628 RepID=A0ABU5E910_9PROT|nr:hypothetical protein [Dongia soli]MDY0882529.1 hypothetical protein [Dongia soli]
MTDDTVDLDAHRGMTAQHETELRRQAVDVQRDQDLLRNRQTHLEEMFLSSPATTWPEAADKASYLIQRLLDLSCTQDQRLIKLAESVSEDFRRLSR